MTALKRALALATKRVDRAPTEAQKEAGNYTKGHVRMHGLDIAIENPKGATRSGADASGKAWKVSMPAHYGYVKGTEGKDGDHVDVYIGPEHDSGKIFVVDQVDADTGKFDEHKAMLGYATKTAAMADYKKAFSDGKAEDRLGGVTEMSVDAFKAWLRSGKTKKPLVGLIKSPDNTIDNREMRREFATGGAVTVTQKSVTVSPLEEILRSYADGGRADRFAWREDMDAPPGEGYDPGPATSCRRHDGLS